MNALECLALLRMHAKVIVLSVKRTVSFNCIREFLCIVLHSLLAKTAACSSSRGMVSSLSGATLDFAAMNFTSNPPDVFQLLR